MIKVVYVLALLGASSVIALLVTSPRAPSLAQFCEDIKAGKAGPGGELSALIDQDRREMQKLLSGLNGKAAAPIKETCR